MDSRLTVIDISIDDASISYTEFPQNVDAFLRINNHHMKLWERDKGKAVVSNMVWE